jgi:hypothetical protein
MKRCNVLLLKRHIGSFSLLQKDTLFQYHIPLERLYKQEKNGKKESVSAVYIRRSKEGAESKKETVNILCSEGGREELGRIAVLCRLNLFHKGVGAS